MVIRARDYKLYDLLIIPIKNSPFWSIITIAVRIFNALLPSLQIYVTAKFIDTAVAIFEGKAERGQIMLPLFLTMGIISYQNIIRLLMDLIDLRINIKMTENFRQAIVEKRARLEYKHIENNDSWDLISRTCKDPVGRIRGGMGDLLGAVDLIIRVVSILMVLMTQVWWAGLLIILICVPLFYIAAKAGKTTYEANKEAEKHHRRG